jgi:predicted nucleic acid-binding protein
VRTVVETNVIAYYGLDTPEFDQQAREFWRGVEDPVAPTAINL